MSHLNAPHLLNGKNGFEVYNDQILHYDGYANGFKKDPSGALKSVLPPRCSKTFQSLQDYLLEVSKALGERRSFYSLNLADILGKIQKWRNMLPNVEFFYAVKAHNDPVLLKLLVMAGTSFDCATEGEIQSVLEAGASPSSILWAHTVKPVEGLLYARSVGVDAMTFDDEEELKKIHRVFPTARLILRICPSMVKCKFDLSLKFGCSVSEAEHLLRLAKQLQMNVVGISFHVGALCTDPDCFVATIQDCRHLFDQASLLGIPLSVLDIGGGFFGASGTESIFSETAKRINQALQEHFQDYDVRVIAEPGCYLIGSAMDLVCTVLGKRTLKKADAVQKHYFLNNGIYGSFFRDFEDYDTIAKPLLSKYELTHRPEFESVIFGQTCCSEDVIQRNVLLPELKIGECVLWENMGAYSNAVCSTFCGVPLPATVYVFDENDELPSNEISTNNSVREFLKKHAVFIGRRKEISK